MTASVSEEIPAELKPQADAALAWINRERGANFKLTGIVEPGRKEGPEADQPLELGLILCEGDLCLREQIRIEETSRGFSFHSLQNAEPTIPPELDPPVGVRQNWLDAKLEKHAFIVLLYYRGLW